MTKLKLQKGFGMIELMISTFLITIVISVGAGFFVYFIRNYSFSFEEGRIMSDAESALRQMSATIREAKTSESGAYPLVMANDWEIIFFSDVDNDNQVERVRYLLDQNELKRGVIEPMGPTNEYNEITEVVKPVASHLVNDTQPLFYYYNGSWPADIINNPLVEADRLLNTRLIKINLLVNTGADFNLQNFEISTEVMLRNLKSN